MPSIKKSDTFEKLVPVLVFLSVILAFAVGILWQKVSNLEGGGAVKIPTAQAPSDAGANQPAVAGPTQGKLTADQVAKIPEVTSADHILGSADAPIKLIEYSDFQCPYCSRFHPTTQQVLEEYGDQVVLIYRHFPLDQLHPQARPAAIASECVAELGGVSSFWKFADSVFADQTKLSDIPAIAESIGMSKSAVQNCIDSGKFDQKVEDQYQGGITAGITGTPGNFIINSKGEAWLIPGALPYDNIKAAIDEALQG